jgi:hypothetical protein
MIDLAHRITGNVHASLAVRKNSIIPKAALPQLVHNIHVLMRNGVSFIMRYLFFEPMISSGTVQI